MCGEAKEGEESLHPLTHPPTFVLFWPPFFFFLKTCCFCGWSAQSFSQIKQEKARGDGEAALCRLNGAIVRHGGGEGNGS